MILRDHRQENKRKRKTNSSGWIETSTRVTAQGRSECVINTAKHYSQNNYRGEEHRPRPPPTTTLLLVSKPLKWTTTDKET
jgi:hypothetical protein